MTKALAGFLAEASDPQTPSTRLREISQLQNASERTAVRQVLAANPNLDEELLWELAIEFPAAVADNPGLQLIQLREPSWWTICGTGPLLSLLSVMGEMAPEQVRGHLFDTMTRDLMLSCPLELKSDYGWVAHNSITVKYTKPNDDDDFDDRDDDDEAPDFEAHNDQECDQVVKGFTLSLRCAGESYSSFWDYKAPSAPVELCDLLEALLRAKGDPIDLTALAACGWSVGDDFEMGGPDWSIDRCDPDLPDWDFRKGGWGSVTVTDPTGCSHEVSIDDSGVDVEFSPPTLKYDLWQALSMQDLQVNTIGSMLRAAFLLEGT